MVLSSYRCPRSPSLLCSLSRDHIMRFVLPGRGANIISRVDGRWTRSQFVAAVDRQPQERDCARLTLGASPYALVVAVCIIVI